MFIQAVSQDVNRPPDQILQFFSCFRLCTTLVGTASPVLVPATFKCILDHIDFRVDINEMGDRADGQNGDLVSCLTESPTFSPTERPDDTPNLTSPPGTQGKSISESCHPFLVIRVLPTFAFSFVF